MKAVPECEFDSLMTFGLGVEALLPPPCTGKYAGQINVKGVKYVNVN